MALRVNRRRLIYALAASLAVHALVLTLRVPANVGSRRAPRPMVAYLAPREAAAPSVEPVMDEKTSIARYRYDLIGAALKYKRYPREAVEAGWEGDVLVRVAVGAAGNADVSVEASSGQPLLDEQALEAFRSAAPRVAVPVALHGHAFGIEVRAVYSLRD